MDLHPGQIGYHPNEFTSILSSISGLVELGIIPMNSTGIYLNGFTPNSTGRISDSTGHEILLNLG